MESFAHRARRKTPVARWIAVPCPFALVSRWAAAFRRTALVPEPHQPAVPSEDRDRPPSPPPAAARKAKRPRRWRRARPAAQALARCCPMPRRMKRKAPTRFKSKFAWTAQQAQPSFRFGQSKGWTKVSAADSRAFWRAQARVRSTKDRAVHAHRGKLCRLRLSRAKSRMPGFPGSQPSGVMA